MRFCIVHKLDRLARNRADDVRIHEVLIDAGVTLVSATESIDQTPSGMFVHGIMSSIAEFYSRNLATEVTKGLTQKLAQGGTPMRAPVGYLNVRRNDKQGREARTVEIDPERAPLIRWAFETYADGETSVTELLRDLTARGLTTVPSPKRPSKPLGKNTLYKLLTNPYYAGVIRYKGALYPGAHEPLIEPALFDSAITAPGADSEDDAARPARPPPERVAALRHLRVADAARFRRQPKGVTYAYFVCSGRASKRTACPRTRGAGRGERLVADADASITINDATYRDLAANVDAAFDKAGRVGWRPLMTVASAGLGILVAAEVVVQCEVWWRCWGLIQWRPSKRAKSLSKEQMVVPCSIASAARCVSVTRFPRRSPAMRSRPRMSRCRAPGVGTQA